MSKKIYATTIFCAMLTFFLMAGTALAQSPGGYAGPAKVQGGYTGPGPAIVTVKQAESMRDGARISLEGHIIQHLGGEKYMFRDKTGTIQLEIDHDNWNGQTVGPDDLVEIHGKLDKDWNSVELEVKTIRKK